MVRVATKGGINWVTQYRLDFSEDCVTFSNLQDGTGINAVIDKIIFILSRSHYLTINGFVHEGWCTESIFITFISCSI